MLQLGVAWLCSACIVGATTTPANCTLQRDTDLSGPNIFEPGLSNVTSAGVQTVVNSLSPSEHCRGCSVVYELAVVLGRYRSCGVIERGHIISCVDGL